MTATDLLNLPQIEDTEAAIVVEVRYTDVEGVPNLGLAKSSTRPEHALLALIALPHSQPASQTGYRYLESSDLRLQTPTLRILRPDFLKCILSLLYFSCGSHKQGAILFFEFFQKQPSKKYKRRTALLHYH